MNFPIAQAEGWNIQNGLVSFWNLEEASGTRVDSVPTIASKASANNMTANNTPGNQTGQIGKAVALVRASNQYLNVATPTSLISTNGFTIVSWVNLASKPAAAIMGIVTKGTSTSGTPSNYALTYLTSVDRFRATARVSGAVTATANNFGSPSTGVWYFVVVTANPTTGQLAISVNNGTPNTVTLGFPLASTNTNDFLIGSTTNASNVELSSTALDGAVDATGFWNRPLSAQEITYLYNGGNGRQWVPV